MKQARLLIVVSAAACLLIGNTSIAGAGSGNDLGTHLTGFQEVPPILSDGTGVFTASVDSSSLTYSLSYSNLSSSAAAAHIHFGQRGVNGSVVVFICGGGGKPACPSGGGTVTGTVTGADVLGVPSQGVTAGSFADLLRILHSADAYVNVHTANHPGGEIRGQIQSENQN